MIYLDINVTRKYVPSKFLLKSCSKDSALSITITRTLFLTNSRWNNPLCSELRIEAHYVSPNFSPFLGAVRAPCPLSTFSRTNVAF